MQFDWICMRCSITLWQFAKGAQITFSAVAKGNRSPFWSLCMRNPLIACNADHVSNIPLGELNSEKNKMEVSLKFCLPSAVSIPMKAYPTIPLSGQSNPVPLTMSLFDLGERGQKKTSRRSWREAGAAVTASSHAHPGPLPRISDRPRI